MPLSRGYEVKFNDEFIGEFFTREEALNAMRELVKSIPAESLDTSFELLDHPQGKFFRLRQINGPCRLLLDDLQNILGVESLESEEDVHGH